MDTTLHKDSPIDAVTYLNTLEIDTSKPTNGHIDEHVEDVHLSDDEGNEFTIRERPYHKKKSHKTFFLVWSKNGRLPPQVRHSSKAKAKRAARKMTLRHPTQKFYVMQSVVQFGVADPRVIEEPW